MIPVESRLRVRGFWGPHTREKRLKELSEISEAIRLRLRREADLNNLKKTHRRVISDVRYRMY